MKKEKENGTFMEESGANRDDLLLQFANTNCKMRDVSEAKGVYDMPLKPNQDDRGLE